MPTKITRLSSTDVANISVLPFEKKRSSLEAIETPRVTWGYQPVSDGLPKILLADTPMFRDLPKGDDEQLIRQIGQSCRRGAAQAEANMAVARAIVEWRNKNSVRGVVVSPEPLRTTADTLRFSADVAAVFEETVYILNLDCRSSMHLSVEGKEFMKSLIHHTARIGDLREAKVAILRTPKAGDGTRRAILEELVGEPQYSLDDILRMVNETYSVWELILRARRTGGAEEAGTLI